MKASVLAAVGLVTLLVYPAIPQIDTIPLVQWKQALSDNDEYLHALQVMDRNTMENAKALIHNMQTEAKANMAIATYHSNEMGRSLAESEDYLTRLEKATNKAMDAMQLGYLADLHRYYRKAIQEQKLLKEELIKVSPATSVIVMKATSIYAEMEKAGKEQIDLDLKMGILEPGNPKGK
jgi:hypothetical protein